MKFKSKKEAVKHYEELGYTNEDAIEEVNKRYANLPEEEEKKIDVVPLEDVQKMNAEIQRLAQENESQKTEIEKYAEFEKRYKDLQTQMDKQEAESLRKFEFEVDDNNIEKFGKTYDRKLLEDVQHNAMSLHICNHIARTVSHGERSLRDFSEKSLSQILGGNRIAANHLKKALYVGSGNTGLGAEFIPTEFMAQYIDKVRLELGVVNSLTTFIMPSNPFKWPTSLTDPTWYHVGETAGALGAGASATAIKASEPGTSNITFTAEKLAGHIYYDADIVEDSIIAVVPFVNDKLIKSGGEVLERCVIFGDETTGSTNINKNGAAVTTTAGQADYYLVWPGMIYKALVDGGSSYYVDAGAALALSHFETAFTKMGNYLKVPADCRIFVNMYTYWAMLALDGVKKNYELGPNATIAKGQLAAIYGIPIVPTDGIPLAYTDGKISSTASNNTKKNAMVSYAKGVYLGFRREVKLESEKILDTDQFHCVVTMRADMQFPYGSGGQIYIFDAS